MPGCDQPEQQPIRCMDEAEFVATAATLTETADRACAWEGQVFPDPEDYRRATESQLEFVRYACPDVIYDECRAGIVVDWVQGTAPDCDGYPQLSAPLVFRDLCDSWPMLGD